MLNTPVIDGARQELPHLESPIIDGARQEIVAVEKKIDGAWQEVWSNTKTMTLYSNTVDTGFLQIEDNGLTLDYFKFATEWNGVVTGTLAGGGNIMLWLEGDWINPTINLDWIGGFIYEASGGAYTIRVSAGQIYAYTRTMDGQESAQLIVSTIGTTLNGSDGAYVGTEEGQYSGTISGEFDRIGLRIYVSGYGGELLGTSEIKITNLFIDGKKVKFPTEAEFDKQEWG